jgi:hypothetical protein
MQIVCWTRAPDCIHRVLWAAATKMLNWKLDAAISCFILDTVIPKRCAVSGTHDVDIVIVVTE